MSNESQPNKSSEKVNNDTSFLQIQQLLELTRDGFKEVSEELREVKNTNTSNENVIRDLTTTITVHKDRIQRILKTIDGNGREGVNSRLARMETDITKLQSEIDKATDSLEKIQENSRNEKDRVIDKMWSILKPFIAAALGAGVAIGSSSFF